MINTSPSRYITSFVLIAIVGIIAYSCGKTTPIVAPVTTCVNAHKSIYDSVCNMAGTRPSLEHHVHFEYDSGILKIHTIHDTTNINFTISIAPDKTVSYLNYAYTLVDSNASYMHFANYNVPNSNHADIFYYQQKDSFVVATSTTTLLSQVTQTDLDTLFTYW